MLLNIDKGDTSCGAQGAVEDERPCVFKGR